MLFTGGAITEGPGMIASEELREPLRSHTDIQKENAKYTKKAQKVSKLNNRFFEFEFYKRI